MGISRQTRCFTAWIACFAILLASFAPSISHALAAASAAAPGWTEICSVNGLTLRNTADEHRSNPAAPAGKGLHLEHCPFCLTHAGSFGLPPTAALTFPVVSASAILPALFYQSPHPLFVWATPHSRAPPTGS